MALDGASGGRPSPFRLAGALSSQSLFQLFRELGKREPQDGSDCSKLNDIKSNLASFILAVEGLSLAEFVRHLYLCKPSRLSEFLQ